MDTNETTGRHDVIKLSQFEVEALADRMFARAISLFSLDTFQEMRSDTLLAVACLRVLSKGFPDNDLEVRIWRLAQ
jgi:hypothetical protein